MTYPVRTPSEGMAEALVQESWKTNVENNISTQCGPDIFAFLVSQITCGVVLVGNGK